MNSKLALSLLLFFALRGYALRRCFVKTGEYRIEGLNPEYTVVGRGTGASRIVGMAIVNTTVTNSILTVRNPAGNAAALTVTPLAGGTRPVSAHLIITQIG